jgi:uncharacterized protein with ParB-like and HNH nuclease domain
MQPEQIAVSEILKSRYPLKVPMYQRGYAWEDEEIDDFVDQYLRQNRGVKK